MKYKYCVPKGPRAILCLYCQVLFHHVDDGTILQEHSSHFPFHSLPHVGTTVLPSLFLHSTTMFDLLATLLASLVVFLGLVIQGAPHFSQFLTNPSKGQLRIALLELGTVFLGKQHESREGLFAATRLLLSTLFFLIVVTVFISSVHSSDQFGRK
jgi:hypothetical protein